MLRIANDADDAAIKIIYLSFQHIYRGESRKVRSALVAMLERRNRRKPLFLFLNFKCQFTDLLKTLYFTMHIIDYS